MGLSLGEERLQFGAKLVREGIPVYEGVSQEDICGGRFQIRDERARVLADQRGQSVECMRACAPGGQSVGSDSASLVSRRTLALMLDEVGEELTLTLPHSVCQADNDLREARTETQSQQEALSTTQARDDSG